MTEPIKPKLEPGTMAYQEQYAYDNGTLTPNLERILLWCEALESGRYMQTAHAMRRQDGALTTYCCLGVATELYSVACHNSDVWWSYGNPGGAEYSYLPPEVSEWFGLTRDPGLVNGFLDPDDVDDDDDPPVQTLLTASELNDDKQYDFIQIAAAVRQRYGLPPQTQEPAHEQ